MGNMSYCRFQNTVTDLQDCYNNLFNNLDELLPEEKRARKRLIELCQWIVIDIENEEE